MAESGKKHGTAFVLTALFCGVLAGGGVGYAVGMKKPVAEIPMAEREGYKICYEAVTGVLSANRSEAPEIIIQDACQKAGYDNRIILGIDH